MINTPRGPRPPAHDARQEVMVDEDPDETLVRIDDDHGRPPVVDHLRNRFLHGVS